MNKNDLIKQIFLIGNIVKDINSIEEYLPTYEIASISEKNLIYKRKIQNKKIIEYENDIKYNILENKLIMKNGEHFQGTIIKKSKEIYLKKGIYSWPSGIKYIGSFNNKNFFEGYGKIKFKNNSEFESQFSNGFPIKNGKLRIKTRDGKKLYIQSDFKSKKVLNIIKIRIDGKTVIEIIKNNSKIYNFIGIFKDGKIINNILLTKNINNNRFVEIRTYYKNGKKNGLLQIKDTIPGNTFQFIGEYKYGYREGFFKIKDTINNIIINEEFHDLKNSINKIVNILKKKRKNIMYILLEIYRKKILEIKYTTFIEKMNIILKLYIKKYYKKVIFHLNQYKYLSLFNQKFKTNYYLEIKIIHLNKIKLGVEGLYLLCKINFFELNDISLNEVGIADFSMLKNAIFPNLKILSLGKNKISSIDFLNILPFQNLENLSLGGNLIEDLKPLNYYKSNKIKSLFLLDNKISDISPLINMNTPYLEILYLGSNISDISPLIKCKFPKLKQLSFNNNKIKNISPIKDYNFPEIELLVLSYNKIDKIGSLLEVKFPKLNELSLKNNLINNSNSNILYKFHVCFPNLKKLDISKNKFITGTDDFNTIILSLKKVIKNVDY